MTASSKPLVAEHKQSVSHQKSALDAAIANIAPTESVLSLMDEKGVNVGLEQGALILAHYQHRSESDNIKLLKKVPANNFNDLFFFYLEKFKLPNRQFLEDIALLIKQAGFSISGQLNWNIARAMKKGTICEENIAYLSELVAVDEATGKIPQQKSFLTKLNAELYEVSESRMLSLWKDSDYSDYFMTHIYMAKLHKVKLFADFLNLAARSGKPLEVIQVLLKEGLQVTSETVNQAFYTQAIPLIDYFYDLKLRPSQDAYFILFESWDLALRCGGDEDLKYNIIQCIRRLQVWWREYFPKDFFRNVTIARHRSLVLVDLCLDENMRVPPEDFPEFVERLIGDNFSPEHLQRVEQTLNKLRSKLDVCDERHTFLHAVVHGKKPSPAVVDFLIQNKVGGVPSTELIEFAIRNAQNSVLKEVVLSLLNAPEAKIGIIEGAAILSCRTLSEADKVEYLKHFYARTKMLADDLFVGYLKIYETTNRKSFEDNLRLIREAGIPSSKLRDAIVKAWEKGELGENTRYLEELGYLHKKWIGQGPGMYKRSVKPKVATINGGSGASGSASSVPDKNIDVREAHDERMFRKSKVEGEADTKNKVQKSPFDKKIDF